MSARTPEEDAGYVRFTVILPSDVVKKLDLLKTFASLDNRNHVLADSIEFLNFVVKNYGYATRERMSGSPPKQHDLQNARQSVDQYVVQVLSRYWASYSNVYDEGRSGKG